MRKNRLILIAALAFAAAQLPALAARAELAPQHQAAIQQVHDAYDTGVTQIQQGIDGNAMNQLQNSSNPLLTELADEINDADTPEEAQEAVDDFMETANEAVDSGGTRFMTDEAQAELGNAMAQAAASNYAAFLRAEAARLAQLKAALENFKRIRAVYKAILDGDDSEDVGMNDADMLDRQQQRTGHLAGLNQRIVRSQQRTNHPHVPRHPPRELRLEIPR